MKIILAFTWFSILVSCAAPSGESLSSTEQGNTEEYKSITKALSQHVPVFVPDFHGRLGKRNFIYGGTRNIQGNQSRPYIESQLDEVLPSLIETANATNRPAVGFIPLQYSYDNQRIPWDMSRSQLTQPSVTTRIVRVFARPGETIATARSRAKSSMNLVTCKSPDHTSLRHQSLNERYAPTVSFFINKELDQSSLERGMFLLNQASDAQIKRLVSEVPWVFSVGIQHDATNQITQEEVHAALNQAGLSTRDPIGGVIENLPNTLAENNLPEIQELFRTKADLEKTLAGLDTLARDLADSKGETFEDGFSERFIVFLDKHGRVLKQAWVHFEQSDGIQSLWLSIRADGSWEDTEKVTIDAQHYFDRMSATILNALINIIETPDNPSTLSETINMQM